MRKNICMGTAQFQLISWMESGDYEVMNCYDPNDLKATAEVFDDILNSYSEEYEKVGIQVKRYANIDEFVQDYQEQE